MTFKNERPPTEASAELYQPWRPEAAKAAKAYDESAKASKWDKLIEGVNWRRYLPPTYGMDSPYVDVWLHDYKIGEQYIKHVCPTKMHSAVKAGGVSPGCASCIRSRDLYSTGRKADGDRAYKMSAKRSTYWQTIDTKSPELGVRIAQYAPRKKDGGLYEPLLAMMEEDEIDFTHPLKGRNLRITREGTGKTTNYKVLSPAKKVFATECPESSLEDILDEDGNSFDSVQGWLSMAHDLREFARVPSSQDVERMITECEEDVDDEPARPRAPRRSKGATAQSMIEDEDDGDTDE